MKQFATWEVNGEEYKLKLVTSAVCKVEEKLGTSLMTVLTNGGIPSLTVMLIIAHAAMVDFNAGIKKADVDKLFDKYVEEGGSQVDFLTNVILEIFKVSGFFSKAQAEKMEEEFQKAQEQQE